jgi:hypothetical protein
MDDQTARGDVVAVVEDGDEALDGLRTPRRSTPG